MSTNITTKDILEMIKGLLIFPHPQICRHYVAANLLSLLEKRGWKCSNEFAKAVVDADDETAIRITDRLIGGQR